MIRRMQIADAASAAEIWLETNLQAHGFIPSSYWKARFDSVKAMIPQAETYVYETAEGIQGFIGLEGNYIAGIFVRKESQSRGIGGKLLEEAKRRKSRLRLHVYCKNCRAVEFYRREGFAVCAGGTDAETGEEELTMEWTRP